MLSVGGVFENRGDTDWQRVRLTAGMSYRFNTSSSSFGITFYLILPDGTRYSLLSGSGGLPRSFVAPETGDYFVVAESLGDVGTSYSITVTDFVDAIPNSIATTQTLSVGGNVTQSYGTSDGVDDWYSVILTAGQSYQLTSDYPTDGLGFYNSLGQAVAFEINGRGPAHFTPGTSGTYYVGISASFSTYTLALNAVVDDYGTSPAFAGSLSVGTAATGTLENIGDDDWFAVTLNAGQSYRLLMDRGTNTSPGAFIEVRDSNGALLMSNGRDFASSPEIIFTSTATTTYYISASTSGANGLLSGAVNYTLSATAITDLADNASTSGMLTIGGATSGYWQGPGDRDWYAISLSAGTSYSLGVSHAGGFDPFYPEIAIYDATGALIPLATGRSVGLAVTHFTALTTGTYYVSANAPGYSSGTINYSVSIIATADDVPNNTATARTITVGGTATGNTDDNLDADWFTVTLIAGVNYRIFSPDGSSGVSIRNAAGQLLTSPAVFDEVFSPSTSGTYYLEATGYGGAYTVAISTIANDVAENNTTVGALRESFTGTVGADTFNGVSEQHETFNGSDGNDLFFAGAGYDFYIGGSGVDTISFANYATGASVSLAAARTTVGGLARHIISQIENVIGTDFDDTLIGNSADNVLDGGSGASVLAGNGGTDRLILRTGADGSSVDGGTGTDTLVINNTVTSLAAISGIEVLEFSGSASLTLTGSQFATGLANNSTVSGTGSITVNMTAGVNFLSQNFIFSGGGVTVTVNGSSGIDIIKSGTAVHTINGGGGNDQIRGGTAADVINGGADNDKIIGFTGADIITGGTGSDQFRYLLASDSGLGAAADRITDFTIGGDRLNFLAIDTDAITPGDQGFAFVANGAFSGGGVASIRYTNSGADLLVQADVNGNGIADMEIILQGLNGGTLTAADFIL